MTTVPPVPHWSPPQGVPPAPEAVAPPAAGWPTPAVPVAPPVRRGRRRALPWVALGLLVGGLVVLFFGFGGLVVNVSLPDDGTIVAVPGQRTVELTAGSTYTFYAEVPAGTAGDLVAPEVGVVGPSGDAEVLVTPSDETPYDRTDGYTSHPIGQLTAGESGRYRVTTSAPAAGGLVAGTRVSVGDTTMGAGFWAGVGLSLLGIVLVLAGAVVGVVWLVTRNRRRGEPPSATGPLVR